MTSWSIVPGSVFLFFLLLGWVGCANPSNHPSAPAPAPVPDNRSWASLGPAGFSSAGATDPSLAVSSTGSVYLAYSEAASGKTTVRRFNGTSWDLVGDAGFGPPATPRLAVDSADRPIVTFVDGSKNSRALTMQFDGQAWQPGGQADFTPNNNGTAASLVGGGGHLYSAFEMLDSAPTSGNPRVFQYDGTTWTVLAPTPASLFADLNYHWPASLAVDSGGTPYLATQDQSLDGRATVLKWNGTNWTRVGAAGFSQGGISQGAAVFVPALAFDSLDHPYLAYIQDQSGPEPKVSVMKFNGTDWSLVGPAGISPAVVESSLMVVDTLDVPFVSYIQTNGATWPVEVLKFDGTAWVGTGPEGTATVGTTVSVSGSFVKGPSGAVYLAFIDHDSGDKITVMVYR